jgi:asparagine synthase (glutamine-hydrolysing)
MENGCFGGILDRHQAERLGLGTSPFWPGAETWSWAGENSLFFLHARGRSFRLFDRGEQAILLRGHAVDTWSRHPHDLEHLADRLLAAYREQDNLVLEGIEGSFTIALLDGSEGKVLLYRNLVGNGYTYYHETSRGFLFSSNLAILVGQSGATVRPNEEDLPTFFVNRNIPGRNTLFAGFHRLLPGEQAEAQPGQVSLTQRRTLGDLREARQIGHDALDQLDEMMGRLCAEYAALDPRAANLLSGGVDSSFLQVHWDRARPESHGPSRSACVSVDHPRTRPDTDYALSAARALGANHAVIPADEPYAAYLIDTLVATGEPPNHVQLAYFHRLAQGMTAQGVRTALSAEAADSLFGLATANRIQNAALLRSLCPVPFLRRGGAVLAGLFHWEKLRGYFDLADHLNDMERLEHPVNQAAVFADWPSVEACFGREAVATVAARRRTMLDDYHVPHTVLDRLHAAGYLGSAMNTASFTTTVFNHAGLSVFCPFLDSRMLRLVVNLSPRERFRFRKPKELLKRSLGRHGHAHLAYRHKLGFGQPIFEWLAPGGQLRSRVEQIDSYEFLDPRTVVAAKDKPNWFLYSLLCYDLWHKLYVSRDLAGLTRGRKEHLVRAG